MEWDLPIAVKIDGVEYPIRNGCDYRVVLDVIGVLNDNDLNDEQKVKSALFIFYGEKIKECENVDVALEKMLSIINNGDEHDDNQEEPKSQPVMNWQHDFKILAPPISRVLGYDIRTPNKHTHWMTFLGGYMEIGECTFSTVVSVRKKLQKGKKLEKWEQSFYQENKKMVVLPNQLSEEEREWLDSEW